MFSKLKAAWAQFISRRGTEEGEDPATPAIEYKGYRIRPTPYLSSGLYQTAGIIEKDSPDGVKEHRFVRADAYRSRDDAVSFTIAKSKQIIDLQGDRIFT